jgi:hypothetical protein
MMMRYGHMPTLGNELSVHGLVVVGNKVGDIAGQHEQGNTILVTARTVLLIKKD